MAACPPTAALQWGSWASSTPLGNEAGLIGQSTTASPLDPLHYTLQFASSSGIQTMFKLTSFKATAGIFDGLELMVRLIMMPHMLLRMALNALQPTTCRQALLAQMTFAMTDAVPLWEL